jgi:hypothetical protein
MDKSVYSSSVRGTIPYATPDRGREIVLIPGLNGIARLWFDAGSVHLDHEACCDGGTVTLSPSGLSYIVLRSGLAAVAQGLNSLRYRPARV